MSRVRRLGLWCYIAAVLVAGLVVAVLGLVLHPLQAEIATAGVAGFLAMLIGLAGAFPVPIGPKLKTNVVAAPAFVAVLLLHPSIAAVLSIVGVAGSQLVLKRPWRNVAFNAFAAAVYVGGAGLVYLALNRSGASLLSWEGGLAAGVAAVVFFLVNRITVGAAAGIQNGAGAPVRFLLREWQRDVSQEATLLSVGVVAALTAQATLWSLVLLVVPVFVVHKGFSQVVKVSNELQDKMVKIRNTQAQIAHVERMASLGTFSVGIGHQINNPLFAIRGRTELLLNGAEKYLKTDEARKGLEAILQMTDRVALITNTMLTSSRSSRDGKACADVNEALDTMVTLLEKKIMNSRVTVLRDYQEGIAPVPGEAIEVQEAFGNLISNACDAMPDGGVLKLTTRGTGSRVVVEIDDTGVGIPEANLSRVFDPFFSTKKKETTGFGLGLYVVKSVVEARKGKVLVESKPGVGTNFRMIFPAVDGMRVQTEVVASERSAGATRDVVAAGASGHTAPATPVS